MKFLNFIKTNILIPFRDVIFPQLCFSCDAPLTSDENRICNACWNSLEIINENDLTIKVLKSRFKESELIDNFTTLYYFEPGGVLQKIAHSLKYESITNFGFELGKKIGEKIKSENIFNFDYIIPVPLHKIKERERGFNQSNFIANGIGKILNKKIQSNFVLRNKNTVSQTKLNYSERKENIENAFKINPKMSKFIGGKSFLIVDDVITTGSTIKEVAKVLKNNGADLVFVASTAVAKLAENKNPSDFTEGNFVVAGAGLEPTTFGL